MKTNINHKNFPWPLLWICLLFIIPLCTASILYLFRDEVPFKIIPSGHLLATPINAASAGLKVPSHAKAKWQLIYLCNAKESKNLKDNDPQYDLLKRIHLLLGKDQTRVILSSFSFENSEKSQHFSQQLQKEKLSHDKQILLLDPRGYIILYYSLPIQNPKGMLEDIRRLLRYSHVG